jgi:hypothetical protein
VLLMPSERAAWDTKALFHGAQRFARVECGIDRGLLVMVTDRTF